MSEDEEKPVLLGLLLCGLATMWACCHVGFLIWGCCRVELLGLLLCGIAAMWGCCSVGLLLCAMGLASSRIS